MIAPMRWLLLLPAVFVAACVGPAHPDPAVLDEAHFDSWRELDAQKATLWELGLEPKEFDFEEHGKVVVSNWRLTGWPGNVFVNARVRYTNTTDRPVMHAIVWLEVLDEDGNVAGSTGTQLRHPAGYPFWPGWSYSLEVRTPTNGAHLGKWSWGIACKALEDPDPGDKPVLLVTRDRIADGQAPGSEWRKLPRNTPRYNGTYYSRQFDCFTPTHRGLRVGGSQTHAEASSARVEALRPR